MFALLPLACVATGGTPRERIAGLAPCVVAWALVLMGLRFGFVSIAVLASLCTVLLFTALRLWRRGKMDWERAALPLLAAAAAARLAYVPGTPYTCRQHDGAGHVNYITYLVENHFRIPALDYGPRTIPQFYHLPLHYLLSAMWIKLQMLFGTDLQQGLESVQALTLLWPDLGLLFSWRLFKALSLRGGGLFSVSKTQLQDIYLNFDGLGIQDSNIFLALLKSMAFDDYSAIPPGSSLAPLQVLPLCLYIFVAAMTLYMLWRGLRMAVGYIRRRPASMTGGFLLLTCGVLMASFIQPCFAYPFACTQHARYVLPLFPISAACAGKGKAGRLRVSIAGGLALFSTMVFAFLTAYTEVRP